MEPPAVLSGMDGLRQACSTADTVQSVLIRKAEALFDTGEERYEATVTVYAVRDSMIYFSAVNSGFEVLRGSIEPDSITVIDRMNKIVYLSPVKRRFGYSHPVDFPDVLNLIDRFFLCDDLDRAQETDFSSIVFDFEDPLVKKQLSLGRVGLKLDQFEYYHSQTDKYLVGERKEDGFHIFSNFMVGHLEVKARGGEVMYNQHIRVKMQVNPRRYTLVKL